MIGCAANRSEGDPVGGTENAQVFHSTSTAAVEIPNRHTIEVEQPTEIERDASRTIAGEDTVRLGRAMQGRGAVKRKKSIGVEQPAAVNDIRNIGPFLTLRWKWNGC